MSPAGIVPGEDFSLTHSKGGTYRRWLPLLSIHNRFAVKGAVDTDDEKFVHGIMFLHAFAVGL
jgi:hypothetical protein